MIGEPIEYITDILIKSLQDDINKDTLWRLFGDIIYNNIEKNLKESRICCKCQKRFTVSNTKDHSSKYCSDCKNIINKEKDKKKKQKKRNIA